MAQIPDICHLVAPCAGWLDALGEAPDPVFAHGMMGDGVMLDPVEGRLVAPCAGTVIAVAQSGHAVTLRSAIGAEILIHVGIDTVALNGRGFTPRVAMGQAVEAGTPLLDFDIEAIADAGKSLCIPIVLVNGEGFAVRERAPAGVVVAGAPLMAIVARATDQADSPPPGEGERIVETIALPLAHGLHARPAARLVAAARPFAARLVLSHGGRSADARSVASLMALGAGLGAEVEIAGQGADAPDAVAALRAAIAAGLSETPVDLPAHASSAAPVGTPPEPPVPLDGSASLAGVTGAPGVVVGPIRQFGAVRFDYAEQGQGLAAERTRFEDARARVRAALDRGMQAGAADQQDILAAHLALLDDPALVDAANDGIAAGRSAEAAWASACGAMEGQLAGLDNARLRERADDVRDIEAQVLAVLCGHAERSAGDWAGAIVVADELWPSQLLRLAADGVAGVCTVGGGATSHVSILAAGRGIAALVATDPRVRGVPDGTRAILAADQGRIDIAPPAERLAAVERHSRVRAVNRAAALADAHAPCTTRDGARIEVFANLGASADAARAVENGAEGCGLLRSEFLFLDRAAPPDEEEQLAQYQAAADGLDGRPLVIRTLDIGGDKPVPFLRFPAEENPALGLRGVRLSLRHPDLLKAQFRALLRVRSAAPVQIMLPMVIEPGEVAAARTLLDEAQAEIGAAAPVLLGIMVETPSAALLADTLAIGADFFSIGTNDLTQYVLAIDRASVPLAHQSDGLHPAVLRSIAAIGAAGRAAGRTVSVCGALGGEALAIPVLIGLGVARLSITPGRIAEAKAIVRSLAMADCRRIANEALALGGAPAVRALVRETWPYLEDWA